jgi:hypothetical protein
VFSRLKLSPPPETLQDSKSEQTTASVYLDFNFIDRDDGIVVDVVHTGEDSPPRWSGTIKGMPSGIQNYGALIPERPSSQTVLQRLLSEDGLMIILPASTVVLAGVGLGALFLSGWRLALFVGGVVIWMIAGFLGFQWGRQRYRIPRALRRSSASRDA